MPGRGFPPLSLPDMLEASARRRGDAPLIDFYGRKFSYAMVADGARRFACGLKARGIGRGDRVGLLLPNVPHYAAAYFGILRLGAVAVNLSPLYSVEELKVQVDDSGLKAIVTLDVAALLPSALAVMEQTSIEHLIVGSIAGALPAAKSVLYRLLKQGEIAHRPDDPRICRFSRLLDNDGDCPAVAIDPEHDLALIQYTGGTTGLPKGAMLSHQNLTANARQVALADPRSTEDDRVLGVLPLFHVFAMTCVLNRTVYLGGEIVMLPRFDAGQMLAAVTRMRPSILFGVPTMYQALLDHSRLAETDFSSFRACVSGGAPMAPELKARFETATGTPINEGYGLTESSGVVSVNPFPPGANKAGTVGLPLKGTLIVLMDRDDPSKQAAPGQPGEITFGGPQVMQGYWNRPEETAAVFVDGRVRTGDVGVVDAGGYLTIIDRIKDMISVGGFKVFPSQVEAVLYRHPAVKEALVIAVPDPYSGERPKAFVTLRRGMSAVPEQLLAWAEPHLGKHERLAGLEIRESLPRTMVGKLSRKDLIAQEHARSVPK